MDRKQRFALSLALAAFLAAPVSAQFGIFGGKDKDKTPAEKLRATEQKNLARYEKLKEYSINKYQTDADFRDQVDQAYDELLRDHSQRAYLKNTQRDSYINVVHEDSWRVHTSLYDNLLVQAHVNRVGQSMVPPESELAFAFKVVPDPTPLAETLATGTVYVSTGLISLLDTEAQLAYVLAHEMAHVDREHWRERVTMQEGTIAYETERQEKIGRWVLLGTIAGGALGAGIGAATGNAGGGTALGVLGGYVGSNVAGYLLNRPLIVDWDRVEEDQADEIAFKAMLDSQYDVREVPALYVSMERATLRDARVGLGFLGDRRRIAQRKEKAKDLIENAYKAEIEAHLARGFLASSAEHRNLMAEIKRDNGIMAYYHDMFELARTNLAEATAIRDNDPAAHYFYGKVLEQVGRTPEELREAREAFYKATIYDTRNQNFGAHLHLALIMAREKGVDGRQVAGELDRYVTGFARWQAEDAVMGAFPPNLDSIYEYMTLYGDAGWRPKAPDLTDLPQYQILNALIKDKLDPQSDAPESPIQGGSGAAQTAGASSNSAPSAASTVVDAIAPAAPAANPVKRVIDTKGKNPPAQRR